MQYAFRVEKTTRQLRVGDIVLLDGSERSCAFREPGGKVAVHNLMKQWAEVVLLWNLNNSNERNAFDDLYGGEIPEAWRELAASRPHLRVIAVNQPFKDTDTVKVYRYFVESDSAPWTVLVEREVDDLEVGRIVGSV